MTYHEGLSITPKIGGFYNLRAGLQAFVNGSHAFCDSFLFKGILMGEGSGNILWYPDGRYSSMLGYKHELDIVSPIDGSGN